MKNPPKYDVAKSIKFEKAVWEKIRKIGDERGMLPGVLVRVVVYEWLKNLDKQEKK